MRLLFQRLNVHLNNFCGPNVHRDGLGLRLDVLQILLNEFLHLGDGQGGCAALKQNVLE